MSGGSILGGAVGAVAGYFMPGGGAVMALKGMQMGMTIGGYLDPPKGPTITGPRIDDLTVQTSTYGAFIPRGYGTFPVMGNVFWIENNKLKEKVSKKKSGGKGGGGSSTTKTYTYYGTFAVGLCKGQIHGVRRIWIGSKLVFDRSTVNYNNLSVSNKFGGTISIYTGSETQNPDPRMQATLGVANTPAYRGLAYIVFKDLPLKEFGNSIQGAQVKAEVQKFATIANQYIPVTVSNKPSEFHCGGNGTNLVIAASAGTTDGIINVSKDGGLTFTQVTVPGLAPCGVARIVYFNNRILLFSQRYSTESDYIHVYASKDGFSWVKYGTVQDSFISRFDVCEFKGKLYITSMYSRHVLFSADGATWQKYSTAMPAGSQWVRNAASANKIYAIAFDSLYFAVTSDGQNWSLQRTPFSNKSGWEIKYYDGVFYAFDISGNLSRSYDDGVTWETPRNVISSNPRVAFSDFAFITSYTVGFAYSKDKGQTWTAVKNNTAMGMGYFNGAWFNVSDTNRVVNVCIDMNTNQTTTLDAIVSAECQAGRLTTSDIDVTELASKLIRGYRITSPAALKASFDQLQAVHPFDIIQSGYKLKFKARGGASVVTIPKEDLAAVGAS